jgi:hypothetical protein
MKVFNIGSVVERNQLEPDMNNAINSIIASLETLFSEQDAKIADDDVRWALGRRDALNEFKKSEEYIELRKKGAWGGVYPRMFGICGGKTWYAVFTENSTAGIEEFMRKNAAATACARTAKIATKLAKAGVEQVESAEVAYTKDGFQGVFIINGNRRVTIDVIYAGGWNIQRAHQRVLVKVK